MGLSIGIVGLPNVGKSTTFNALTKAQNAESANYPFCTIEPNKAIVPVPDPRIEELSKIVKPERVMHSTIEFVDIAGLVKGASQGEGLGNQFLTNIRECEMILHMVRCFDDGNVVHVDGSVDPIRDINTIETELILADIQSLEKKIERLTKLAKNDKKAKIELEAANELMEHLNNGEYARTVFGKSDEMDTVLNDLRLLSAKEIMYGMNVDEDGLAEDNTYVKQVEEHAKTNNALCVKLCAKIEEEMIVLDEEEKKEMLESLGVEESGLEQIIRAGFEKLGLISYFTAGIKEVRAWTIEKGWKAPKAASVIHNDFEKGFIRAEVISYEAYIKNGGEQKSKEAGDMRLEGKEYVVQDGDVMHFRFNV